MIISSLVLGAYENNCYILRKDEDSKDCVIIDTGLDSEPLMDFLQEHQLNPILLFCTHGHADHIAGINALREEYPEVKIAIHKNDAKMLASPSANLSVLAGGNIAAGPADILIESQCRMNYAGLEFDVIETPGHTPGGVCAYFENDAAIFVGDTLFAGSVGRTDFPGYDQQKCFTQLIRNIKEKLLTLPEHTKVYSGHGPRTSIRNEIKHNPCF